MRFFLCRGAGTKKMRVIICGSPSWNFDLVVQDEIVRLYRWCRIHGQKLLIIHGGEPGPEAVAERTCRDLGIDRIIHPANKAYGHSAWFRRNQLMLQEHQVDLVIVFTHKLKEGTMEHDMMSRAKNRGRQVKLIDFEAVGKRNSNELEFNPFNGVY